MRLFWKVDSVACVLVCFFCGTIRLISDGATSFSTPEYYFCHHRDCAEHRFSGSFTIDHLNNANVQCYQDHDQDLERS